MINFEDVIYKLKIEIEKIERKHEKVTDKKLSQYLGVSQSNFATLKTRENIPFLQIIMFCQKHNIDTNYIFEIWKAKKYSKWSKDTKCYLWRGAC